MYKIAIFSIGVENIECAKLPIWTRFYAAKMQFIETTATEMFYSAVGRGC